MKPEQEPRPDDKERSATRGSAVATLFRSVPAWDITDEEISEWQHSRSGVPGVCFAGYIAAAIRDGRYDGGGELFPPGSMVYREITRETVALAMEMLMDRGMVRKSGGAWYPVVPGRLEPSTRRAVAVLLARRADLPPALAAELDSWKRALEAPDGKSADQAATGRAVQPTKPLRVIAADERCVPSLRDSA
jgi:hypothetical protein